MDDLFTPVSQTYLRPQSDEPLLKESKPQTTKVTQPKTASQATSSTEALESLRSQPDYDTLISTLAFLVKDGQVTIPGPLAAQIAQVLVSDTLPNYWPLLKDGERKHLKLLLQCLRSLTGINAILARAKALIQESKEQSKDAKRTDIPLGLVILLQVLSALLDHDQSLLQIWAANQAVVSSPSSSRALGHEFVSLFAGGKILSVAAEAEAVAGKSNPESDEDSKWMASGSEYTAWLGRNIAAWMVRAREDQEAKLCSGMFVRGLRLGYSDRLTKQLIQGLLLSSSEYDSHAFLKLFSSMTQLDQKRILFSVIKYLSDNYLNKLGLAESSETGSVISAAAGIIHNLVEGDDSRKNHLVVWLTGATGAGLGDAVGIRRAVLATLSEDKEAIATVVEKGLNQFGDQLYIKHAPVLQQEAHAQVLLLAAGYLQRHSALKLRLLLRTGDYLRTISNRLNASQSKARVLGMTIGEALSSLADTGDIKLDFKMEDMDTDEVQWLKGLTATSDTVGSVKPIVENNMPQATDAKKRGKPPSAAKPAPKRPVQPRQTGFVIEEVDDSDGEEDEDADLKRYSKRESDPEDSDEDPELVRRGKPKAPVYVRDLISYLRDTNSYDKQQLGLTAAPSLIRRKANFGTEVTEHAEELASILVGLGDKYEIENFLDLRQQGMLALIVAQPKTMAPWFARTYFDGDYSISQRAGVLSVLGLGAREVAGFDVSGYAESSAFPSKRLPEKMERLYLGEQNPPQRSQQGQPEQQNPTTTIKGSNLKALPATALDTMAQDLTKTFLAPLAADAADKATGPDVLKLSSFTQRLNSQGKPKSTASSAVSQQAARLRTIPNTTASLLASCFFFPLTARMQHALRSPASHRRNVSVLVEPYLLSLFLKTLALVIHAAGPSTLALPQMTSELWDLLLGARAHLAGDLPGTHAILMAFAALLEVNDANAGGGGLRRLCAEMPREVVETQEWVSGVFNGTRGEDGGEENEVKMLAAGVLITLQEAMEKHRALLMGDMIGY